MFRGLKRIRFLRHIADSQINPRYVILSSCMIPMVSKLSLNDDFHICQNSEEVVDSRTQAEKIQRRPGAFCVTRE